MENNESPTWDSLSRFLSQPIRMNFADYGHGPDAVKAYQAARAKIARDRADARFLISAAERMWEIKPILASLSSSRLTWSPNNGWEYCAGQYYPTEVCGAVACAVANVIFDYHRDIELASPPVDMATGRPVENPCKGLGKRISDALEWRGGPGSRRVARWFR
jgi:hypothetical protein